MTTDTYAINAERVYQMDSFMCYFLFFSICQSIKGKTYTNSISEQISDNLF